MFRLVRSDRLPATRRAGHLAIVLGSIWIAGCGATPTSPSRTPTPADGERLAAAQRALVAERDAEARTLFESLTSPAHASGVRGEAFLGLGRIALRSGDVNTALDRLGEARGLLRRHAQWPTAELLYGAARIRAGHLQSGIDALENAFGFLVSPDDRTRAAYLIVRSHEVTGNPAPESYRKIAGGARFPEYDPIFAAYDVKPIPRPVVSAPAVRPAARTRPEASVARETFAPGTLVTRSQWGAQKTRRNVVENTDLSRITIHHTADQGDMVSLGNDDTASYLRRLQAYFQDSKGYADLPYHFLISDDGKTYIGRPLRYQGAHAGGSANRSNIGIALIGNFESKQPSQAQLRTLRSLVASLSDQHHIGHAQIFPHCDLKDTRCPGAQLEHTVRSLYGWLSTEEHAVLCEHGNEVGSSAEFSAD